MRSPIENLIIEASKSETLTPENFKKLQRLFCKLNKTDFDTSDQLIRTYHKLISNKTIKPNSILERILTLKSTRSDSGIVVVSVLTKPYPCPGKCIYCPTEKNVPKSYLSCEPAVRRAIICHYHPYTQMMARLQSLEAIGHSTDKITVRIIGGTWSHYPKQYQNWFVRELFKATNHDLSFRLNEVVGEISLKDLSTEPALSEVEWARDDNKLSLDRLQKFNETAHHRIVEISVETRQDHINIKEIIQLRKLGITKVELGVQTIYDPILKLIKRGNLDVDTIRATRMLKDAGFKVSYQLMLNLPESTPEKDIAMFKTMFGNQNYQPDHIKIYPLALVEGTGLMKMYDKGLFEPYDQAKLIDTIAKIKRHIPYYCRIERVIRDIPSDKIREGGAKISNLRQMIQEKMKKDGETCHCIRCREVKNKFISNEKFHIFREDYDASGGREIFLSLENKDRSKLYSLLRFRIPESVINHQKSDISILTNAGLIRELHTYGPTLGIGQKSSSAAQHRGFGKQLILEAENIARKEFGISKMAVIAGVGVRDYFRKLGYHLRSTYMIKKW